MENKEEILEQGRIKYQKQCVVDKMEWLFEKVCNFRDFADCIVDLLGIEPSDKLAEDMIDEFALRDEYEEEPERLSGGYDRNGNPTITYTKLYSGESFTETLN